MLDILACLYVAMAALLLGALSNSCGEERMLTTEWVTVVGNI